MACELEVSEFAEVFVLAVGHECYNEFIERYIVRALAAMKKAGNA